MPNDTANPNPFMDDEIAALSKQVGVGLKAVSDDDPRLLAELAALGLGDSGGITDQMMLGQDGSWCMHVYGLLARLQCKRACGLS